MAKSIIVVHILLGVSTVGTAAIALFSLGVLNEYSSSQTAWRVILGGLTVRTLDYFGSDSTCVNGIFSRPANSFFGAVCAGRDGSHRRGPQVILERLVLGGVPLPFGRDIFLRNVF